MPTDNNKNESTNLKFKLNKKITIITASLLAVLIAVAAVFFIFFSGPDHSTPESITRDFLEANYDADADDYIDCLADFTVSALYKFYKLEDRDALEDYVEKHLTEESPTLGNFEIKSCKRDKAYDKDEIYTLLNELNPTEKQKKSVKDVAAVNVDVIHDNSTETLTFYCALIDDEWFVFTF